MDEKESPPVTGCLQLLLGFPVLILATNMAPQWRDFLLPLLPRNLSANAVSTIYGFSLLALILAGWTIITRVVDALFGTRLYPYYSKAERLPLGELAERTTPRRRFWMAGSVADELPLVIGVLIPFRRKRGSTIVPASDKSRRDCPYGRPGPCPVRP